MKIVITARNFSTQDKSALNMLLEQGFEVADYSHMGLGTGTTEEQMIDLIGDADILIAGLEPFSRRVIEACPNIKMLSKRAIGYDSVDLDACRERSITVTRTTGMVEAAVAEHVMAYILHFARELPAQNEAMHQGKWQRVMSYGAKNRTLGLVGFGGIGKEIAKRALPFGMEVLYYCRHPKTEWEREYGVRYCSFEELLSRSDYISANVNLSDSTRGMFGAAEFARMKQEAVFINIARGAIMDPEALRDALMSGHIRGAGIDVYDSEPCCDSPLVSCPNAILTPHTAPYTSENFREMNRVAAQNVLDFLTGQIPAQNRLT